MPRYERTPNLAYSLRCFALALPFLLALLAAAPALQAQTAHDASPQVLTPLDYFADGQVAVQAYLDTPRYAAVRAMIARVQRHCARVEVSIPVGAGRYHVARASAVVFDGGRYALTAAHSFNGSAQIHAKLTMPDGEVRQARVVDRDYDNTDGVTQDWAVLEILGEPLELPNLEFGHPRHGELAIVLGYPDQIGTEQDGTVNYSSSGAPLEPLVTLASVADRRATTLEPRAGAIPTGGMSGGAVIDGRGRLLGIFRAIARTQTDGRSEFRYQAAPIDRARVRTARAGR